MTVHLDRTHKRNVVQTHEHTNTFKRRIHMNKELNKLELVDETMTVKELQKVAKGLNLMNYSRLRKAELIEFINDFINGYNNTLDGNVDDAVKAIERVLPSEMHFQTSKTAKELTEEVNGEKENVFKHLIKVAKFARESFDLDFHVNSDEPALVKNHHRKELDNFVKLLEMFVDAREYSMNIENDIVTNGIVVKALDNPEALTDILDELSVDTNTIEGKMFVEHLTQEIHAVGSGISDKNMITFVNSDGVSVQSLNEDHYNAVLDILNGDVTKAYKMLEKFKPSLFKNLVPKTFQELHYEAKVNRDYHKNVFYHVCAIVDDLIRYRGTMSFQVSKIDYSLDADIQIISELLLFKKIAYIYGNALNDLRKYNRENFTVTEWCSNCGEETELPYTEDADFIEHFTCTCGEHLEPEAQKDWRLSSVYYKVDDRFKSIVYGYNEDLRNINKEGYIRTTPIQYYFKLNMTIDEGKDNVSPEHYKNLFLYLKVLREIKESLKERE